MSKGDGPHRGEIYLANLDPTRGREQAGTRPVLIVSTDIFNTGGAELVIVVPLTSQYKRVRSHVPIEPPEGSLRTRSYAKCEDVRSLSKQRLGQRWGRVSETTMENVADHLRILMEL